ncbi:hypothetical protein ACYB2S_00940 [Corynebacterium variabile]|uniref:hypothetical protein n=1 Tax=Corynebacterium variabile TaxID=1727 RepID=UPI003CB46988
MIVPAYGSGVSMYDNRYTGDFPSVEEHNMATLAGILPGRMESIDDEHRGMSLSVAAVWILSDGILRVVLRVKDEDEQRGALLGYEVLARQMLASFPSTTEEDLAGLFVWEYLAGDDVRGHAGSAEPGKIHWVESVIDIPRPRTLEQVAQISGAWTSLPN